MRDGKSPSGSSNTTALGVAGRDLEAIGGDVGCFSLGGYPAHRPVPVREPLEYPSESALEEWATEVGVEIGDQVPTASDRLRALELLYRYRHLEGTSLADIPVTLFARHRVRPKEGSKPHSAIRQRRLSPLKEKWLHRLIREGMKAGIYEMTLSANGKLSAWNANAVLVDKKENPGPEDEPRLTFNYSQVPEDMPGSYLRLASSVHDFLENPRHNTFCQLDLKHGYFCIEVEPEDRHIYAFTIPGIGQLQPTRMPQGSATSGFTMTEVMFIMLGEIPGDVHEPSLLGSSTKDSEGCDFYMDDVFVGQSSFEAQFAFQEEKLFPRIEWAKLRLSFKKLRLFVSEMKALGVRHIIGGKVAIVDDRIRKIASFPQPAWGDVSAVRAFVSLDLPGGGSRTLTR